jgi:hypothetical protein
MKITLSIPRTISSTVNVRRGDPGFGIAEQGDKVHVSEHTGSPTMGH